MASSDYRVEIERPVEETASPDGPVFFRGTFDLEANAAGAEKSCWRAAG